MTVMYLPENWDFSVRGIISIVPDGRDAVYAMLARLIELGYCTREPVRSGGKFADYDYDFHEEPIPVLPDTEKPDTVKPIPVKPDTENPPQSEDLKDTKSLKDKESKEGVVLNTSENRREVFEYWQTKTGHTGVFFNKDFQDLLRKLFKQDFTVEQLKRAVDGNKLSPFHCGNNDRNTVYDSFDLIFRDGKKVAYFIGIYEKPPSRRRGGETFGDPDYFGKPDDLDTVSFSAIEEVPRRPAPDLTEWEQGVFDKMLRHCEARVNSDVFRTWFGPIICDGVDDKMNMITLRAGPVTTDWLRTNYTDLLAEALGETKIVWIKESAEADGLLSR